MNLFTIGFSKKSASEFFNILLENSIKRIIDIRLNNKSQLAGFTKEKDIKYFLNAIGKIDYIYMPILAPTKVLLNDYKKKKINWIQYESEYLNLLKERGIEQNINISLFDNACLLCSEMKAENCHRRLAAEYLSQKYPNMKIIHL